MKCTTMRPGKRTFVGLVVLSGLIVTSCSGSAAGDDVTIVIDDSGWAASGGSVDDGVICPRGSMVGSFLDLDGSPLSRAEGFDRVVEGIWDDPLDEVVEVIDLSEYVCADGSGSFTLMEEPRNGGPWSVREGLGDYAELQGSGTLEIERQPTDDPDGPPGGFPSSRTLTGTIEIAG
jgi:hypothetical protein